MINRFMAIKFPLQAQALGHQKINQVEVVNFWQRFMRAKYKRVPHWIYTKGAKKQKAAKEKKLKISSKEIISFAQFFKFDRKAVEKAIEFWPKEMQTEFKAYAKMQKEQ